MAKDSHLSTESRKGNEKPPIPLHKRLAMGKGNGTSNPNGAARASTEVCVANGKGKNY